MPKPRPLTGSSRELLRVLTEATLLGDTRREVKELEADLARASKIAKRALQLSERAEEVLAFAFKRLDATAKRLAVLEKKNKKQIGALPKAREISAARRSKTAQDRDQRMKELAIDYFRPKPSMRVEDAVTYIQTFEDFKNTSRKAIASKIKGVKKAALRSLHTK